MWLESLAILGAGIWAGMINVIVGSGTLVTFPVLLMLGYPPITANISSSIGLVAGSVTGAIGFRREIAEQARLARLLLPAGAAGGLAGGLLLLTLPPEAFRAIVPVLVALGIVMVVVGPLLTRWIAARRWRTQDEGYEGIGFGHKLGMIAAVFALGMYGGYFGAALGVILLGALGLLSTVPLPKLNAIKNLLVAGINGVSAILFIVVTSGYISWRAVALLAIGSTLGGLLGALIGRRIPAWLLRATVVVVGSIALANLLLTT